jgi:RES domain-containing protein
MLLYRLAKTARATDLSGEGAKRAGGRWNYAGVPVVYTAENGALAILEVLQYADISDIHSFSMLTIDVPDTIVIQQIPLPTLPTGWQHYPHLIETKELGQQWIDQGKTLLLQVPSAVYPEETNWLINPQHPDAKRIQLVSVKPFIFSDRLFK